MDYCASFECGYGLYAALGAQPFNYTDAVDALPNAIHAFAGTGTAKEGEFIDVVLHTIHWVLVLVQVWDCLQMQVQKPLDLM